MQRCRTLAVCPVLHVRCVHCISLLYHEERIHTRCGVTQEQCRSVQIEQFAKVVYCASCVPSPDGGPESTEDAQCRVPGWAQYWASADQHRSLPSGEQVAQGCLIWHQDAIDRHIQQGWRSVKTPRATSITLPRHSVRTCRSWCNSRYSKSVLRQTNLQGGCIIMTRHTKTFDRCATQLHTSPYVHHTLPYVHCTFTIRHHTSLYYAVSWLVPDAPLTVLRCVCTLGTNMAQTFFWWYRTTTVRGGRAYNSKSGTS